MEWFRDHLWESWLGLTLMLALAELLSLDLVLAMLAAGAFVGMLAAILGIPIVLQVGAACVAAAAMLFLVRPNLLKHLHTGPELRLGAAKLVGMQGIALSEISGLASGRIKVDGEEWTARPLDDTMAIAAGEIVDVVKIDGATAVVYPVPRLES